ncbi:hypothetical protein QQ008_15530 [Fulvivirgaceae bacterium BMA10]|uniref:Uncharacterized protein n=1 Tax=Splendidivirga corallicola TaxID=3051826 RepID=A0ABT8KTJ4_9BACT|nr:hypothetical protein [Fulvivirgaceae bacterium BMA10]
MSNNIAQPATNAKLRAIYYLSSVLKVLSFKQLLLLYFTVGNKSKNIIENEI